MTFFKIIFYVYLSYVYDGAIFIGSHYRWLWLLGIKLGPLEKQPVL